MDFEFHYYITGIIAHKAGFTEEETQIIAYASQFVDDNTVIYDVEGYLNYISQTVDILKPKKTLIRIYPIFHFIPGNPMANSARRKDGKMHILNTIPDSKLSQKVMSMAFKSPMKKRLYRIGIASHTYTDTWAHQNFVGFNDSFNNFNLNPIPNIGHSDVLLHPDRIGREWKDTRLVKKQIKNNDRFILAAERLFYLYTEYLNSDAFWPPVKSQLWEIMNHNKQQKRINLYSELIPWLLPYDEYKWFNDAIDQKVRGLKDSRNEILSKFTILKDKYYWKKNIKKEDMNWFKFQESVKDHQTEVLPLVNDICKLMGVDIKLL